MGGVGTIGLRGGVAPLDLTDPEGVEVRLLAVPAEGLSRIEE